MGIEEAVQQPMDVEAQIAELEERMADLRGERE